jgi:DNA-binding NtrC family response regulator
MPHLPEIRPARPALHTTNGVDAAPSVSDPVANVSALIVEPALPEALALASALTACRFDVIVADTFQKAKASIAASPPVILITEIRLADYNGLQLVLRGKSIRPDMAAIVLSDATDMGLQADAEAIGATYMLKPVTAGDLRAAVFRTLGSPMIKGRQVNPIRPPFERRRGERRIAADRRHDDRRIADRRRDLTALLRLVAKRR